MKLRELVQDIRENLKQWSDDSALSDEYIAFLVTNNRNLLLSQKYSNAQRSIPNSNKQALLIDLELADDNEFIETDKILRSVDPLPTLMESFNFKRALKINNSNYTDQYFTLVSPSRFPYVGTTRYTRDMIYVTLGSDNRLYFRSGQPKHKVIAGMKVWAIWGDPETVYPLSMEYDSSVDFLDVEYPLEPELVAVVKQVILKELLVFLQMPEDKINDATDS